MAYEKALRIGTVRAGIVFSSVSHRLRQLFLEIEEKLTDAGQGYAAARENQVRQVTKHAARQKAGRQAVWLPDENMFPGSGVSRYSPDVFWQQQAEYNENRRCGPRKEDAGRNGGVLGGSGKCCAGEQKTWQRMAFEAPFVPPV